MSPMGMTDPSQMLEEGVYATAEGDAGYATELAPNTDAAAAAGGGGG